MPFRIACRELKINAHYVYQNDAICKGVINLRGVVTPADLRERFDLPVSENEETTRIIIITLERWKSALSSIRQNVLDIDESSIEQQRSSWLFERKVYCGSC